MSEQIVAGELPAAPEYFRQRFSKILITVRVM